MGDKAIALAFPAGGIGDFVIGEAFEVTIAGGASGPCPETREVTERLGIGNLEELGEPMDLVVIAQLLMKLDPGHHRGSSSCSCPRQRSHTVSRLPVRLSRDWPVSITS